MPDLQEQRQAAPAVEERGPTLEEQGKSPLREMLMIAAPSVATMTSYTVMQFVDKLMVKDIGPEPIYVAAQGNGGILAWTAMSFALGATGVLNSFVSQNLGAGRPREGARYAWNGLYLSVIYYLAIVVPIAMLVPAYYAWLGAQAAHTPRLIELETSYARIMLFGGIFTLCARALSHYFYGMHRPWVVLVAALTGNLTNVFLNWVLIFGNLGAPRLGIEGAAYATVLGGLAELVIPMVLFLSLRYRREFGTHLAWRWSGRSIKDIVRVGWPAGAMFTNEILCWQYLMVALIPTAGRLAGDDPQLHNTAGWIGLQYMHLSFMPAVGVSIATTALVGKAMGMGRPDLAHRRTMLGMKLTLAYMGLCAVAFLVFREQAIAVFVDADTPPEVRARLVAIGAKVMIAAAIFQLFDAVAIVVSGALRGAGDTVWPGAATILLSWTCIVGGGHLILWLFPGIGSVGPWAGAALYIISLGTALMVRYAGGRWRTMSLVRPDPGADVTDGAPEPGIAVAEAAPGTA